jgi:hypothetical protein
MSHWSSMKRLPLFLLMLAPVFMAAQVPETCPATGVPDPNAGCAKPLTGCICFTWGTVTSGTISGCGGCTFEVHGGIDCNDVQLPFDCGIVYLSCQSRSACGAVCPCTGNAYFPFALSCGLCP